jgi:cytochrome b
LTSEKAQKAFLNSIPPRRLQGLAVSFPHVRSCSIDRDHVDSVLTASREYKSPLGQIGVGGAVNKIEHRQAALAVAEVPSVTVWDWGVRLFHWSLLVSVAVCAYTGFIGPRAWLDVHFASGVLVAALVGFRLVWGWTGTTYALFRSFAISPSSMLRHLSGIAHGRGERHLGHNPLGAAMVFSLLGVLTLLILTGVVALGGALKQGPLAFIATFSAGVSARELHELLAIALLAMIAAHLAGVAFESWRLRENLVKAMITGRKAAIASSPPPSGRAHPLAAAAILGFVATLAIPWTIILSKLPARGAPTQPLDATYVRECGSCHLAYPPSLATAQTWRAIMDGLTDHFGENASLDPAVRVKLGEWLAANASERFDTQAANLVRRMNPAEPQRITAAPAWVEVHRDIPDAVFKSAAVGAKGACNACHRDAATGRFDPQRIAIPIGARP